MKHIIVKPEVKGRRRLRILSHQRWVLGGIANTIIYTGLLVLLDLIMQSVGWVEKSQGTTFFAFGTVLTVLYVGTTTFIEWSTFNSAKSMGEAFTLDADAFHQYSLILKLRAQQDEARDTADFETIRALTNYTDVGRQIRGVLAELEAGA